MRKKFGDLGPVFAEGGEVRKELKFMADKGAPKSMITAEKKEHGLPVGKAKYDAGGIVEGENRNIDDATRARARAAIEARLAGASDEAPPPRPKRRRPPVSDSYRDEGRSVPVPPVAMEGPKRKVLGPASEQRGLGYARGGSIDGCASRGKTRGKVV